MSFLDSHSGSLLTVLTAVYVLGTFLMLRETRRSRLKAEEPNIQISLEPQARWGNFFDLVIANIGNVPVYNFSLKIEPAGLKTIGNRKLEDINLFKKSIPVLGKGEQMKTFAISYVDFIHSDQQKQISFTARYKNANGKEFVQKFDFDLEVYENMSASSESSLNDVVSEMKDIKDEISKVARHFEMLDLKKSLAEEKDEERNS
jgi:hypothetical protein